MMVPRDDFTFVSERLRERREAAAAVRAAKQDPDGRATRRRWAAHLRSNAAWTLRRVAARLEGSDVPLRPQARPQRRLAEPYRGT